MIDVITEFGVSGVPVVSDDNRVVGVISEADLLPMPHPAGTVYGQTSNAAAGTAGALMTGPS
ncbi:CBS domain-containing protein [Dactylosporangium sp. CS-047395]|uniref:CBS domain-containing protein n=1 Tax=Dactylosporangium sp. CS-047395 TaxID=3239936 RepID=UPI003D8D2078